MQDAEGRAHTRALPQPRGMCRARVQVESPGFVLCPKRVDGIRRHRRWRRYVGKRSTIRAPEQECSVRFSVDPISVLVDRAMVSATKQCEIRQRRRAATRPVLDMMPLADGDAAAREATVSISMLERATERRRNRPRLRPDLHHAPFVVVSYPPPARVARQALRRFCGNAVATLEDAIARLIGIRQARRIDVPPPLIALARRAGIDAVMQRRLG